MDVLWLRTKELAPITLTGASTYCATTNTDDLVLVATLQDCQLPFLPEQVSFHSSTSLWRQAAPCR